MMPCPARPPGANYRAPPLPPASADEVVRELALAWASLAAVRGSPSGQRRVTVLRPFAF